MTHFNLSRLLFVALVALAVHPALFANSYPPRAALVVAIGDYPTETGWQKISSLNDVPLIKNALLKQGFQQEDIAVLTDHDATRDGILRAIRSQLLDKAKRGGTVFFHFSGHGQQVADDDGDELDGFDEAIVPINSPINFHPGVYEGEHLIRDDELGRLFREIRAKLGPEGSMLVVLDACHSGTGTRGFGIARGTQVKMAPENYVAANLSRGSDQGFLGNAAAAEEARLAPLTAFFGAAHNQLNFETYDEAGNSVGSLSYAFSKKFTVATPNTTYRGLFENIRLEMSAIAPRQQPQAEGALDRTVLGGSLVGVPAFFRVIRWNDPSSVSVEAGWLTGVHQGTVIGFFPPETRSATGKNPMAKGTVTYADATSCIVSLDTDLSQDRAMAAWAFLLEQSFGSLHLPVRVDLPPGHAAKSAIEMRFEKLPVLRHDSAPELIVAEPSDRSRGASLVLMTQSDHIIETFPDNLRPEILAERVAQQVMAYGQARFLKNLEIRSHELQVDFEVVPVHYDRRTNAVSGEIPLSQKMDANGIVHFNTGDVVRIKVRNHGYQPAYFTLLDIQPDNKVNVLIPDGSETPAEFLVPPGQTFEVRRLFEFGPPEGTEVFKLIATDKPLDLRSIAASRGAATKSNAGPFERLFSQTFYNDETMSRGGRTIAVGVAEVNVSSFVFVIK